LNFHINKNFRDFKKLVNLFYINSNIVTYGKVYKVEFLIEGMGNKSYENEKAEQSIERNTHSNGKPHKTLTDYITSFFMDIPDEQLELREDVFKKHYDGR